MVHWKLLGVLLNDPTEQYSKRRCTAMWCTVALHILSVIILLIGLMAATRTGNVAVAGYYSGIIVSTNIRASVMPYSPFSVKDMI